jgi:epoxyqueuosine reductase QueG
MNLDNRISILAQAFGADYYGVADLSHARDHVEQQGGKRVGEYPRAVVMGIRLLDELVDLLPERGDPAVAGLYRHHTYDVANQTLDQIALRVANTIQKAGYRAFPVPASKRASDEKIAGIFSQKLAAHMAGLGWIGKSCLLITPENGPRVRWISVLTDAPFTPTGTPMEPRCGKCTACVDICPVHAFTGRPFIPEEPREARFNAAACDRYFKEMEKAGHPAVCGMCLYICPHGRKPADRSL